MTSLAPWEQRWAADQAELRAQVRTLQAQMAALTGNVTPTTSTTHPTTGLYAGMPIYETDTGLAASWSGSAWAYYLSDVATPVVLTGTQASVPFTISSSIRYIVIKWQARTTSGNLSDALQLQINSDTTSAYGSQNVAGQNATASAAQTNVTAGTLITVGVCAGGGAAAGYFGGGSIEIPGWGGAGSGHQAVVVGISFVAAGTGASQEIAGVYGGAYNPSAALTGITLKPAAGSFAAGSSFSVLGCN